MLLRFSFLNACLWLLFATTGLQAATFYWDANGATAGVGGTGNWNTSSSLWRSGSDTGTLTTFSSSTSNVAYLTGTAGTVTVTTGINVNKIFVDATSGNYTISQSSAGNDLNLGGTAPEINVASGETLTMRSFDLVTGTTGDFHKTGAGKVLFTGYADNNFGWRTGQKFVVDDGTAEFNTTIATSDGAFDRTITLDINSGGTLLISATNGLGGTASSYTNTINVNGGTLTLNANQYLQTVQMTGGTINGTGTGVSTTAAGGLSLTTSASSVSSTISTGVTLNAASTFTVADGSVNDDLLISGQITGSSGFTKAGAGEAVLTNTSNSYSGITTVSVGTLNIQSGAALGATTAGTSVTGGAALEIQGGITVGAEALTLNGTGISSGGALRNISGNNTYGGLVTLGSVTRINSDTVGDTLTLSNTGTITGATFGLTVGGVGNTSISSIIGTTSGTLTKDGTGTLTLTGTNTYTGLTTVSAGVLNIQNASALGTTAAGTSVTGGAALELQGGITVGAEALTLNGTGISSGGALRNISGNNTYGGQVTLGSATRINSDTVGTTLSLSNTGTITGATFGLTVGGTGNTSIASIIGTTSGTLTKDGTGTLTLTGINTYTGTTTVSGGTLQLGDGTTDGVISNSSSIANNAALIYNTIGSQAYSGIISGSGTVTKNGAGELVLTGANSYTGLTTVNAGVLNIQHATALGTTAGGTSVTNGAALEIEGGITVGAEALTLNGTGISNGGSLRNVSGNNTYGGLVTLGSATRINSDIAGTTLTLSNTGTITGATLGMTVGGAGNTSIVSSIGTTSGTLTKDGSGTLTLSGANTFTGATAINAGTLSLNYATQNNSKLADASALTFAGGTLDMSGGSHTEVVLSTTISSGLNGITRSSGSSVLRMNVITRNAGATVNFSAAGIADTDTTNTNGILGAWATINGSDWAMNSSNAANGSITAYNAYVSVNRLGLSTITTGAATNVRIVNGGTSGNIALGSATTDINTLKMEANAGAATIDPTVGQILRLGTVGGVLMASGSGALTIGTIANDGVLTAGGAVNTAGEITFQQYSGNTLTVNSTITNNGTGVVKVIQSGTGTTVLTGTNTYTGSTTVNGGTLSLSADANLGTVPGSVTADMVVLNGGTLASTANFSLDANRGLTIASGGGTIDTSAGTTLTYNGLITGSGALNKNGTGTFITGMATFNSHTGPVNINEGIFEIAKTAYVGAIDNNAAVTIATGAMLKFNGAVSYTQETIGSLSGDGIVDNVGLDNINFLVGDNNMDTTFSGVIKNTGTKVINFEKRGTGILKLTGTNAYTGSTTVTAGTLQIDGVVTSAVQVNANANLSGSGSVSKAVTINGVGALRPGNKTPSGSGLGTFTLSGSGANGDLTVATTGTLGLQLGANGIAFAGQSTNYYSSPGVLNSAYVNAGNIQANANDRILVGGTLSLTSGSIIDVTLSGYNPSLGDAFELLDWATLSMGTFTAGPSIRTGADSGLYDLKLPDITSINSDYRWDTSLFATNGIIVVVPEPSRVILLMAGLSACFLRRRRKQAV